MTEPNLSAPAEAQRLARRLREIGIHASLSHGALGVLIEQHLLPIEQALAGGILNESDPLAGYARALRVITAVNAYHQRDSIDLFEHHFQTGNTQI